MLMMVKVASAAFFRSGTWVKPAAVRTPVRIVMPPWTPISNQSRPPFLTTFLLRREVEDCLRVMLLVKVDRW